MLRQTNQPFVTHPAAPKAENAKAVKAQAVAVPAEQAQGHACQCGHNHPKKREAGRPGVVKAVTLKALLAAAAFLGVTAAASPARAGLTPIQPTPHATEQGQADILSHYYGGTFNALGNGFTNGTVTATRIDDVTDSIWNGANVTLTPVASFSRSEQSLGLLLGKIGGNYEQLFSVNQFGYLTGTPATLNLSNDAYRFTLDNSAIQLRTSSLTLDNGVNDQLVTYKIDGLGGSSRYLLFWEDTPLGLSDRDYNDLVVEANFAGKGGPMAVPLPPAVLLGLTTLGGTGLVGWLKKRKHQKAAA